MDLDAARTVLGVEPAASWETVRATYRTRIRQVHPDVAPTADGNAASELNEAYRVLLRAHRSAHVPTPATVEPSPTGPPGGTQTPRPRHRPPGTYAIDLRLIGRDTIVLGSPPPESFRRLVSAAHAIGEISYLDRSAAILEAVLELDDGSHASLVVSLQWRAHDATCEAFCTLEALERAESLDVSGIVEQLLPFIPDDDE